jgi:hypothetical protein
MKLMKTDDHVLYSNFSHLSSRLFFLSLSPWISQFFPTVTVLVSVAGLGWNWVKKGAVSEN